MKVRAFLRRTRTWLIAVPVLAFLLAVVAPYVYIHFIQGDPPAPLTFSSDGESASSAGAASSIDGTWTVSGSSEAGYRVAEVLFGQSTTAVGRTSDVTGEFVIDGTTIAIASFEVDLTTVSSDESRRDGQFQNRIMDTSTYPTATFELTQPITLDGVPDDLEEITVSATGNLTLHGVTKSVTFELTARRNGDTVELNGTIPVTFSDYGIDNPSGGPASVGHTGEIEFLLTLAHA